VYNQSLMLRKVRRLLAFSLLLFSGSLLIWSFLPAERQVDMQLLPPAAMSLKSTGQVNAPALLESRRVKLEWPSSMRIGDHAVILLDFEIVNGDTSSPKLQTGFSDAYSNYNVMAEGKFETVGITVEPANPTRESMPPGQPVRFKWEISAEQAGTYHGNVWLSLRFLPRDGSTPIQEPIYVSKIMIHTTSLLGLNGSMARLVGGMGVLVSFALLINEMIGVVIGRKKKIPTKV
jgi:hypothetical protein